MRDCQPGKVADMPLYVQGTATSGLTVSTKTGSSFSNHSLFATDFLGLPPGTGPVERDLGLSKAVLENRVLSTLSSAYASLP